MQDLHLWPPSQALRVTQALSIANEGVRFWQHIKCPLLLVLFLWGCGRGGGLSTNQRRPRRSRVIQNRQIFRAARLEGRIKIFDLGDAAPSMGVGHDDAGVDGEGLAPHDALLHTAPPPSRTACEGDRSRGSGRGGSRKTSNDRGRRRRAQSTKPPVSQIEMDLLVWSVNAGRSSAAARP
jgi:hypothetical protein